MAKTTKNSAIMTVMGAVGGAVGARLIMKHVPITDPKIKALIPLGLGGVLIMYKKSTPVMKGVGYGMVGASVPSLAEALVPGMLGPDSLAAPDDTELEVFNMRQLNGPADQSILAGTGYYVNGPADQSILAGNSFYQDEMNGNEYEQDYD